MKIYRPIKTNNKTQGFGQNLACCRIGPDNKPYRPYKVVGSISDGVCPVGSIPFYPALGMLGHNGEDWQLSHGEAVYFPVDVQDVEWECSNEVDPDGGIGVNIRSKQPVPLEALPPQAKGSLNLAQKSYERLGGKVYIYFKFWHLLKSEVQNKQVIKTGDLIGYGDSSGASGGDHLHWSMKISDETSWFCLDGDNGYTGAVDFSRWFENRFVKDVLAPNKPSLEAVEASLQRLIDDYEKKGDHVKAGWIRAVLGLVRAFW